MYNIYGCVRAIPTSRVYRLYDEIEFQNIKQKLTNRLLQRGYKHKQILLHINLVKFNQRCKTLFRQKPRENKMKLVFVTQFCDDAQRLKQVIKNTGVHLARFSQNPQRLRSETTPP